MSRRRQTWDNDWAAMLDAIPGPKRRPTNADRMHVAGHAATCATDADEARIFINMLGLELQLEPTNQEVAQCHDSAVPTA